MRGINRLAGVKCSLNLKRGEYMSLISQVSKLNKQKKDTFIMFRCSKSFKSLLDYWVKFSGSSGYSSFLRQLVLSATVESKSKKLTPMLNNLKKELKNHD